MSMITISRGPEGLSSLSDQDLHMVTEGLYERMKKIRDHVKDSHRDISRKEEKVTRGFLADTLFDTLNSMDSLFIDKNLWRTILGGGDKAEDFVEETIGLSTFMEYTQEHGGTPGQQDPMYHRQMRLPLTRWYAIANIAIKEILSLRELTDRAADKLRQHMEKHPLISRTREERLKAQLGVHYMRSIGQDLVSAAELPFGFLREFQERASSVDSHGYALEDYPLDELQEEEDNESILDRILLEREQEHERGRGENSGAQNVTSNRSPQRAASHS